MCQAAIREYLSAFPEGTPVALESVGNWYWIVDEIETAGCVPKMAHALYAKKMMAHIHKTDKLDARGLATLEHLGSLPTVWIAHLSAWVLYRPFGSRPARSAMHGSCLAHAWLSPKCALLSRIASHYPLRTPVISLPQSGDLISWNSLTHCPRRPPAACTRSWSCSAWSRISLIVLKPESRSASRALKVCSSSSPYPA